MRSVDQLEITLIDEGKKRWRSSVRERERELTWSSRSEKRRGIERNHRCFLPQREFFWKRTLGI